MRPGHNLIFGKYRNPLRVVVFNIAKGWSRDVSQEITNEAIEKAYDANAALSVGTKRFLNRHIDLMPHPRAVAVARAR
jgi:hypothetical protein